MPTGRWEPGGASLHSPGSFEPSPVTLRFVSCAGGGGGAGREAWLLLWQSCYCLHSLGLQQDFPLPAPGLRVPLHLTLQSPGPRGGGTGAAASLCSFAASPLPSVLWNSRDEGGFCSRNIKGIWDGEGVQFWRPEDDACQHFSYAGSGAG